MIAVARVALAGLRRLAGWAAICGLVWLIGGTRGLLLGAAVAVWDVVRPPTPRQLIVVAAALLACVPIAVLLGGLPTAHTISPLLIEQEEAAHLLAGAGLALLVLGVLRDVRRDARRDAPRPASSPVPGEPRGAQRGDENGAGPARGADPAGDGRRAAGDGSPG